jgi:predicted nuclease of restriction endonuclease-like (RecB) superfamily
MTHKFGWSKNVLIHQIENQSYEKTLLGQTNFDKALTPSQRAQAKLAVKVKNPTANCRALKGRSQRSNRSWSSRYNFM